MGMIHTREPSPSSSSQIRRIQMRVSFGCRIRIGHDKVQPLRRLAECKVNGDHQGRKARCVLSCWRFWGYWWSISRMSCPNFKKAKVLLITLLSRRLVDIHHGHVVTLVLFQSTYLHDSIGEGQALKLIYNFFAIKSAGATLVIWIESGIWTVSSALFKDE